MAPQSVFKSSSQSACYMLRPFILLDFITLIISDEDHKTMKFLTMQCSPVSCCFVPFKRQHYFQRLFLMCTICSYFNMKGKSIQNNSKTICSRFPYAPNFDSSVSFGNYLNTATFPKALLAIFIS
jgi:hypothetical protein